MKKLLTIILLFISYSCTDTTDPVANNEMIPGRDVYIAGYISDGAGNTTACYWKNGKRVDLGPGELEDLVVVDGTVYTVGWNSGASSYWVGNESFELEGSGAEAYAIAVHAGDVYTTGRDNAGACYWKNTKKTKLSGGDSSGYGLSLIHI